MHKKYVFNCATNNSGGAVQNCVNFIKMVEENYDSTHNFYYVLSMRVYEQVKKIVDKDKIFVAKKSPAKSLKTRLEIKKFVDDVSPFLVYSSAGPAYVNFKQPHIMGCSNPYVLGAPKEAMNVLGGKLKVLMRRIHTSYQRFYIKRADYWIVQTDNSKEQMSKFVERSKIYVVNNSISEIFKNYSIETEPSHSIAKNHRLKILIPSAYYAHKMLESVPFAISQLKEKTNYDVQVTYTVDNKHWSKIENQAEINNNLSSVLNIGPFLTQDAVSLYECHDVILQPSILEVFSTSYIEAMAMKKPLVVPRFDFSMGICGDYAYYYDPHNADSIINAIQDAIERKDFIKKIEFGNEILQKYGSQRKRVDNLVKILDEITEGM